ncbi:MAG: alpha/beta fold hydrolase, partial [Acidobacteria bacterium]|nr:alpha/beta fold hydrolase [Acidobacteriota bacterium]
RVAAELTARHPLSRAALRGRFRWSAAPEPGPSSEPASGRDPALFDRPYEAPRNAKERRLARIFQELLGIEAVGVHDDFFALGGHSLLVLQLVAQIQEMSGVAVPLSRLYREPTVAALAQAVAELQPFTILAAEHPMAVAGEDVLVGLQTDGARPALFLVHPGGGHLLNYRELARQLAPDRPLYGLEAPGVGDSGVEPLETIEAMAERYLASIRRHQPRGPYHLAGYCVGGLVAYEMARQLRHDGERVGCLAILDTMADERHRDADPRWLDGVATYFFAGDLGLKISAEELEAEDRERWADLVWERFRERAPEAARRLGEANYRRLYRVFLAIRRAGWAYSPRPYDGRLTLFVPRISSRDDDLESSQLGWRPLALGGVEEHRVPGSHTTMLSSPQVQVLAERLRQCLERAEAGVEAVAAGPRSNAS